MRSAMCPNCETVSEQRAVYAKLPEGGGKQCWEKVFWLCLGCFKRRKKNPLLPVKAKIYSRRIDGGDNPALIISVLKDGSLTLERIICRLKKAGVESSTVENILRPWVNSELISEEDVDYTDRVLEKVRSSKMRLKTCRKERIAMTLLPLYTQSRSQRSLRLERLGFYCISCRRFSAIKKEQPDMLDRFVEECMQQPLVGKE
jgi:hypothetical protein